MQELCRPEIMKHTCHVVLVYVGVNAGIRTLVSLLDVDVVSGVTSCMLSCDGGICETFQPRATSAFIDTTIG